MDGRSPDRYIPCSARYAGSVDDLGDYFFLWLTTDAGIGSKRDIDKHDVVTEEARGETQGHGFCRSQPHENVFGRLKVVDNSTDSRRFHDRRRTE